ncbi:MAG TPA: S-adenosylmethionine:tRNA ribosyltransferase-isomerase, partial [Lapillicoccus sp.]
MTALPVTPTTRFPSPDSVTAVGPSESRGVPRDGVRLLVARPGRLDHVHFRDVGRFLRRGDVLVVNTSGTVP